MRTSNRSPCWAPSSPRTSPIGRRRRGPDMDLLDRIRGDLSGLGEVTGRPMFGGHGLYWDETIFGILFGGKLYLKVDDQSKVDFVSRGMGPFRPNERQTLKSYYE